MTVNPDKVGQAIFAIFLPPLAVFLNIGECTTTVAINIILCFVLWIPAVVHAFWFCFFHKH